MAYLNQFIDAEFVAAVAAALSIPLVIAVSAVLVARKSHVEPRRRRGTWLPRRPFRGSGLRSRRPPLAQARPIVK
jgi:hypothetical protein